jgi:hypothetical protein
MVLRRALTVLLLIFTGIVVTIVGVQAQVLSSSNLPVVVIKTLNGNYIPDEPKTLAHMGIIDNGVGIRNNVTDPFNIYDGFIGIETRGSSSQTFPKLQYAIELRSEAGTDSSASLLGMPAEEDWILFGPWNDKSLIRDALAYKMGRDMGRYAPRTRFCELVLNDSLMGIYVLIEKIKQGVDRVDVSKLGAGENSGDDVTGGYIIKIDKFSGVAGGGFTSNYLPDNGQTYQQIFFQYHYPETQSITFQQQNYIRQYISNFESVLKSEDFDKAEQGYRTYIDVESFIDFMIMNEVSKNVDGYRLSTFLHKDKNSKGGKLKMGPIWDFNLGYGNANYCTSGEETGFVYNFNSVCQDDFWLIPFWWKRFLQDPNYKRALVARWQELRRGKFATENIHAYIDSVVTVLDQEAQQRNFHEWPVLGTWVWPNLYVGATYLDEVEFLKNWVSNRMEWLDGQWDENYVTAVANERQRVVDVFPNPATKQWTVRIGEPIAGDILLEIFDSHGQLVRRFNVATGVSELIISADWLSDGIYFLKIVERGKSPLMKKLIKVSE